MEDEARAFERDRFYLDPISGEGADGNEESILSLPIIYTKDRALFPYMITEENLMKPIRGYVRFYSRLEAGVSKPKHERDMGIRMREYTRRFKKENGKQKSFYDHTEEGTHTDMVGGILGIPSEKEDDFLECYANYILFGATAWFVERPTKITRMFMDFDFNQKTSLSFQEIDCLGFIVQQEIKKFFPGVSSNDPALHLIVSTTSPKPILLDKTSGLTGIKTGVHMHWGFYADFERAMNIRESLKAVCTKEGGKRPFPCNTWEQVIDCSIWSPSGGGLRMMGSDKAKLCKACDKKKKNEKMCEVCLGEKGINEGRPYHALYVMDIQGNRVLEKEKEYKLNFGALVKDTKIRTNFTELPAEPKFVIPEGAPLYIDEKLQKEKKVKRIVLDENGKKIVQQKDKDLRGQNIEITNSDREWDAIEEFITKYSLEKYKNSYVSQITTDISRKSYQVHIKGELSRYCHNISREHSSNRIYFIITVDGMVQRCHDSDDSQEMKFGPCKDYKSALSPLTQQLHNVLFKKSESILDGNASKKSKSASKGIEISDYCIDKKLKMLIILGNTLCKNLYSVNWITENEKGDYLLTKTNNYKKSKTDLMFSMEDTMANHYSLNVSRGDGLGSKSSEILIKLGFLQESQKRERGTSFDDEPDEPESISDLESFAFTNLKNIVEIACMVPKEELGKIQDFSYFYKK